MQYSTRLPSGDVVKADELIHGMIDLIGDNPYREGLKDTPKRVWASWQELFAGYSMGVQMTTFDGDGYDEIVLLKDIEFFSTCEHHLLPFFGRGHVAYLPNKRVIGISKLARTLEMYSRRLQIQERICMQVVGTLEAVLEPRGAACILEAKHLCMVCRGVQKQNSVMVTSSLAGVFKDDLNARQELLSLIKEK